MTAAAKPNKYLVLAVVSLGTVLSGYVASSLDIALSNIMNSFGFTMDTVTWVLLAYMIPYGATLPITGKFGDQFGRKKVYVAGLVVFTVATMMVGLSWNAASVILFRILQGLGAAMYFPNAMALVADAFPPAERGQAMGMWGALAAAGAVLGPTAGGYIVEYISWRALFSSIVPISAVGIVLAVLIIEESPPQDTSKPIDVLGGFTLVASLSALIIALNRGGQEGWTSPYILGLFALTALSLAAFILIESRVAEPLVDLGLFRSATFSVANIVGFLTFMTLMGGLFLIPFFLRNILGYSPIRAGLSLFPLIGAMIVMAPLGGKLADRAGGRTPTAIGMLILAASLYSFRTLTADTGDAFIAVRLVFMGVGLALTMSPLSNAAMATLPAEKTGVGSGVFNLFKNVGGSVGIALFGTFLDDRQTFHSGVLAEYVDTASPAAAQLIGALKGGFIQSGLAAEQAYGAALSVLQGIVAKQAAVMAYADVFQIAALFALFGGIAALLIRDPAKPAEERQPAAEPADSAALVALTNE